MVLFLSYASERKPIAESVAWTLRGRGHTVFFDREDLPPGDTFDDRIQSAVRGCDVLIFLISPESVSPGRFTLTELRFARTKWSNPKNRILPVMIEPTEMASVPAYLKAVTILEPSGNVAAEVAAAVEALPRRTQVSSPVIVAAAAAAVALTGLGYAYFNRTSSPVALEAGAVTRKPGGLFGDPDLFTIPVTLRNVGDRSADVSHVTVVTDPPGALLERKESDEPGKKLLSESVFRTAPSATGGIQVYETFTYVTPARTGQKVESWRICAEVSGNRECTPSVPWRPAGAEGPSSAFTVPADISRNAVAATTDSTGFLVTTRAPNFLYRVSPAGAIVSRRELEAEPTAIDFGPGGLFVGLRPDKILRIDPASLATVAIQDIVIPDRIKGAFDGPVSTTPASIAQDGSNVVVLTRSGSSAAGLLYADSALTTVRVPTYFSKLAFDLSDITLTSDTGVVWGSQTSTTPASLYKLTATEYVEYGGHDYDAVSCALGIAVWREALILPDCKGELQTIDRPDRRLNIRGTLGRLTSRVAEPNVWATFHIAPLGARIVVAVNMVDNPAGDARWSLALQEVVNGDARTVLHVDDAHVASIAVTESAILAILERKDGKRQTVALRHVN